MAKPTPHQPGPVRCRCPKCGNVPAKSPPAPIAKRAAKVILCKVCQSQGFYAGGGPSGGCPACGRGGNVLGVPLPVSPPDGMPDGVLATMADGKRVWVSRATFNAMRKQAFADQQMSTTITIAEHDLGLVKAVADERILQAGREIAKAQAECLFEKRAAATALAGRLGVVSPLLGGPVTLLATGGSLIFEAHKILTDPHHPAEGLPYDPTQHQKFEENNPLVNLGPPRRIPSPQDSTKK